MPLYIEILSGSTSFCAGCHKFRLFFSPAELKTVSGLQSGSTFSQLTSAAFSGIIPATNHNNDMPCLSLCNR